MKHFVFVDKLTGDELDAKGRDVHEARLTLQWLHELARYRVYMLSDCVAGLRYLVSK